MIAHKDPYHPEGARSVRRVLWAIIWSSTFMLGFIAGVLAAQRLPDLVPDLKEDPGPPSFLETPTQGD